MCVVIGKYAPPCFTSPRSSFVHRHRFRRTRYTPTRTPRPPAAPTAAAAFITWSCGSTMFLFVETGGGGRGERVTRTRVESGKERLEIWMAQRNAGSRPSSVAPAIAAHVPAASAVFASAGMPSRSGGRRTPTRGAMCLHTTAHGGGVCRVKKESRVRCSKNLFSVFSDLRKKRDPDWGMAFYDSRTTRRA